MTAPLCLLTRPLAQSESFAAGLPGVDCLIAPILRIEALPFDAALAEGAPGLIFTSANAVPFAGPGNGRQALVVGPQTAVAARAAGFTVEEGPGDAEGMMPLLSGRGDWLHLHGRHRARALPTQGIAVYDQVAQPLSQPARAALAGARPVILPLFSPRSAALLSDAVAGAQAPIATVAISTRADAAYRGPVRLRLIADRPEGAAMQRVVRSLAVGTSAWGTKPDAVG
ncbi:uroporphyrinogen-III synthase [Paracoccus xiamenensis]|uniref:uroporphyrinogen-III synthase n=1 Tax=Paracoccus xiamenensis TaxID=2714901 RepID=UPI0014076C8D|nr:uroporphyrinogen-III synthase [Paracoccus xiamenensis]NHF73728.1 uroporphyrinogen-III synthase [Paracoccus xiamenensis]